MQKIGKITENWENHKSAQKLGNRKKNKINKSQK